MKKSTTAKITLSLFLVTILTFTFTLGQPLAASSQENREGAKGVIVKEVVPESQFKVTVSTDKTRYRIGEMMQIKVRSNRSGYLTLYDIQPNGKVNLLFPNRFQQDQKIPANKTLKIPSRGADHFRLEIGPPKGRDILWAVVSNEPGEFPLKKATKGSPFPEMDKDANKFAKTVKGVTVKKEKTWGAGYSVFYIGAPLGGHIHLSSTPENASIYLNGSYRGVTPMTIYDLKAGQYKIRLEKEGFQVWSRMVQVNNGETRNVNKQLLPIPVNPTINSVGITPQPSREGQNVTFSARATDPQGGSLNYKWTIGGRTYSGPAVGVNFQDDGPVNWSLEVTNDSGGKTTTSGTHNVKNAPPTIDSVEITPSPSSEGEGVNFNAKVSDPGRDSLSYSWIISGTQYSGKSIGLSFRDDARVNWKLKVRDGDGGVTSTSGIHSVKNLTPQIKSVGVSPQPSREGEKVTFTARAKDPGKDSLTYSWTIAGAGYTGSSVSVTFNDDARINWSLEVSDGDGEVARTSGMHSINNLNPAITSVNISPEPSREGEIVSFTAGAKDPGRDSLTYNWTIAGAGYTGSRVDLSFNDDARINWSLKVKDGDGGQANSTGTHTIQNAKPSITSVNVTPGPSVEGERVQFSAKASDPGRDSLNYTWTVAGKEYTSSSIGLTFDQARRVNWSLRVTDGDGGFATAKGVQRVREKEPSSTNVYITSPEKGKVMKAKFGMLALKTVVENLNSPYGIACSPDGKLYVAENGKSRIVSFDQSGSGMNVVAELSESPLNLTFGPFGDLFFTTDQGNIWRLSGESLTKIVPEESGAKGVELRKHKTFGTERNPHDIAFIERGEYSGDMIVSLSSPVPHRGRVVRLPGPEFNRVESFISSFQIEGSEGRIKTKKLNTPTGLATGRKGDVYVGTFSDSKHRILRYSQKGKFQEIFTPISKPNELEIDWHRRLYITTVSFSGNEKINGSLRRYDSAGENLDTINHLGVWGIAICER